MPTCQTSSSAMPKILPKIISCTLTEVGFSEIINNPNAKNVVKINPIMASSRSLVIDFIHKIAKAAKIPEKNAPKA